MSVPCTPGWNDPPVLGLPEGSSSSTSAARRRARVYHSVDGVGAAGSNPHQNPAAMHPAPTIATGPVPPILPQPVVNPYAAMGTALPQQPLMGVQQQQHMAPMPAYGAPPMPQTALPMMQPPAPNTSINPPLSYDTPSTISRLAAQVSKVLGDTSLEIPSRESIIASITSLQTELSLNRISSGASDLVKQFISYLEVKDFKQAESALNAIKQQSETANWGIPLHHLMYYSHLQASRQQ